MLQLSSPSSMFLPVFRDCSTCDLNSPILLDILFLLAYTYILAGRPRWGTGRGKIVGATRRNNPKIAEAGKIHMFPLLFILSVVGLSVYISTLFVSEVTFFTYYVGGVVGLFVSGVALEIWIRRKQKREEAQRLRIGSRSPKS